MRHRSIAEWEQISSALIALGTLFGVPLVLAAAIVGGIVAFRRTVSARVKWAHLCVVCFAAIATVSLLLRFAR